GVSARKSKVRAQLLRQRVRPAKQADVSRTGRENSSRPARRRRHNVRGVKHLLVRGRRPTICGGPGGSANSPPAAAPRQRLAKPTRGPSRVPGPPCEGSFETLRCARENEQLRLPPPTRNAHRRRHRPRMILPRSPPPAANAACFTSRPQAHAAAA